VNREAGVTFAYHGHHGDPYVFPTGVANEPIPVGFFEDPVVRQPDPQDLVEP
jgi:hypothetical protein